MLVLTLGLGALGLGLVIATPDAPASWLALGCGLAVLGLEQLRQRRRGRRRRRVPPESRYRVTLDGEGLRSHHPQRPDERVRWGEVVRVSAVTTAWTGRPPHLYLLLHERGGQGASVPVGAPGSPELLRRLGEVPGFQMDVVMRAQAHDGDEVFGCWEGDGLPIDVPAPVSELHLVE